MNRLTLIAALFTVAAAATLEARAQETAAGTDPQSGLGIALRICAVCHVVSPDQPNPTILQPSAPSFRSIANRPGVTLESLRTFMLKTHATVDTPSNMPNPQLSDDQASAVAGYLVSLRKKP